MEEGTEERRKVWLSWCGSACRLERAGKHWGKLAGGTTRARTKTVVKKLKNKSEHATSRGGGQGGGGCNGRLTSGKNAWSTPCRDGLEQSTYGSEVWAGGRNEKRVSKRLKGTFPTSTSGSHLFGFKKSSILRAKDQGEQRKGKQVEGRSVW